jgi:hypothetical protein
MLGKLRTPICLGAIVLFALFIAFPGAAEAASPSSRIVASAGAEQVRVIDDIASDAPSSSTAFYTELVLLLESADRRRDDCEENPSSHGDATNWHAHHTVSLQLPCSYSDEKIRFRLSDPLWRTSGIHLKIRARAPPAA